MSILKSLDNEKYVCIRKGVKFYYFGSGCIADYYQSSIAYLDNNEVEVVTICDGKKTVKEITDMLFSCGMHDQLIQQQLHRLIKKGVLVLKSVSQKNAAEFFGKKGLYYPKSIAFELTNKCNFQCPFCYTNAKTFRRV